jgi:hypothetical protein
MKKLVVSTGDINCDGKPLIIREFYKVATYLPGYLLIKAWELQFLFLKKQLLQYFIHAGSNVIFVTGERAFQAHNSSYLS